MWEKEKAGEEKTLRENQDGRVKENTGSDGIKERRRKHQVGVGGV